MKGKIIKIDGDNILIRPSENFLDITVKSKLYNNLTESDIGKEVEIKVDKFVKVLIDGIGFYGTINYD